MGVDQAVVGGCLLLCEHVRIHTAVNYRGSGGFGQDSICSLPGKVGTQEVRDVQVSSLAVMGSGIKDSMGKVLILP